MEKKCKYSIRKYAIGACSVMIGAVFFGSQIVAADEAQPVTNHQPVISAIAESGSTGESTVSPETSPFVSTATEPIVETRNEATSSPVEQASTPVTASTKEERATASSNNAVSQPTLPAQGANATENTETEIADHGPLPSKAQLDYHKEELAAFIHFGMNTYTNSEWGNGRENPSNFNPTNLDTDQWIRVLKETGFKRTIMVTKHHDGFVLYPSAHTNHTVAASPWKNGKGDVLEEVSKSATKYDMNLGVYLSPWDANHPSYKVATQDQYNEYYLNQLKEILDNPKYGNKGKFVEVWMDGARGEGAQKVTYTFDKWFEYIKKAEGDITIFSAQPTSVRWIGNEKGTAGDPVWHKVKRDKILANPSTDYLNHGDPAGDMYSVGEADVSIRSGWFYHENQQPKSLRELMDIYFKSVGRGTPLLLNIPPNKEGRFADVDVARLKEFHQTLKDMYATNLAAGASVVADSTRKNAKYNVNHLVDGDDKTSWALSNDALTGSFTVDLGENKRFDVVELKEDIAKGQRISGFNIDVEVNGRWVRYGEGSTVGYRRLIQGQPVTARRIRVTITGAQATPILTNFALYKTPQSIEKTDGYPLGLDYHSNTEGNKNNTTWYQENEGVRGSSMWTNQKDASVEYQFTGTKAYVVSTVDPQHGPMDVYVDGQKVATIDTQSTVRKRSQIVYETGNLAEGTHTIKLVNTSNRAIATEGIYTLNNQAKGMFELSQPTYEAEKGKTVTVTVKRVGGAKGPADVRVVTEPGTGVHGKVYQDKTEILHFADGETEKTVTLQTIDFKEQEDQVFDFKVKLSDPTEGSLLGFNSAATVRVMKADSLSHNHKEYDDQASQLIYSPNWHKQTNAQGNFSNTESWASYNGLSADAKKKLSVTAIFSGTGIDLTGFVDPNHGIYKVSLDGKVLDYQEGQGNSTEYNGKKYFSGKAAQRKGNQTLVSLKGLKDDVHVLTMELDPERNDLARNIGIQLDRVVTKGTGSHLISKQDFVEEMKQLKETVNQITPELLKDTPNSRTAFVEHKTVLENELAKETPDVQAIFNAVNQLKEILDNPDNFVPENRPNLPEEPSPSQPSTPDQPSTPSQPSMPDQPATPDQKPDQPIVTPPVTKEEKDLLQARKQNFNKDWYFKLNPTGDQSKENINMKDWTKLNLPHDWSIFFDFDHSSPARNEGGQLNGGVAWYRKTFTLEEENKDKNVRLTFDGVYMDSHVYVNGKHVGHYPNGYNHFSYDITDYLYKDGRENTIAVQVTNKQPSSRWYSGSGIYRDVNLVMTDKLHVSKHGNKITTPKLKEQQQGAVDTVVASKVVNTDSKAHQVYVEHQVFTKEGQAVSAAVRSAVKELLANQEVQFDQMLQVNRPTLWTTKSDKPQLYVMKTKVYKDNQLVDVTEDTFGYRYFDWTAADGFSLNGERMKFHGVCIHQDNGALGSEENAKAIYRKLKLLKEMGVNAIRTSHNPASEQLLNAAAELGFLVQEEAFDTWYHSKKTYDYGRFFDQEATHPDAKPGEKWSDFDLRMMVEKDKNNPSIIMWSLGNEVEEANGDARSIATAKRLKAVIKAIDTERYVTMGENKFSQRSSGGFIEVAKIMDVVGMNYGEHNYEAVRRAHPDWKIYGSETSSATRTRGSYYDPSRILNHDHSAGRRYEQSDYGNDKVAWGRTATQSWTFDRDHAGYAGQFIWTGIDYIGEPTPWHNMDRTPVKSSFFGIIDTAGLPKNDFYLYQSQWRSVKDKPMVHMLPHWNWDEESLQDRKMLVDGKVPVRVFSNAASVELYLNNESLGKKTFTKKQTADGRSYQEGENGQLYLEWKVAYKPGTLVAVARDESGKEIARDTVTTADQPSNVRLVKEEHVIGADGKDLTYIHYEIVDANGNLVPTANNLVHFNLHGQGEIVGVDNGEQASRERYKAQADGTWKRKAFNGKGVVIVKSTETAGKFTLYADSEGLGSDSATVYTVKRTQSAKELVDLLPAKATAMVGDEAQLPQTVKAVYNDGSTEDKAVTWKIPADLTKTRGVKEVLGSVEGTSLTARLMLKVLDLVAWLPKAQTVPVNTATEDLDKVVTAVFSDGTTSDAEVSSWTLENPDALKTENGETTAAGKVADSDISVSARFRASNQNVTEGDVTGIQVGGKALSDFTADKTYYRIPLAYGATVPTVSATTTGGATATIQQASADNDKLTSVFVTDESGRLTRVYRLQFVEASPALTGIELEVEKTENLVEDQSVPYKVKGIYEDGTRALLSENDVELTIKSEDGAEVKAENGKLLLYRKGTARITARLAKADKTLTSQELTLTIAENTQEKTITELRPIKLSTDLHKLPSLPQEVLAVYNQGLPRKVAVTWEPISQEKVDRYHSFTVKGRVAGTDIEAQAHVTVEGFLTAEEVSLAVPKGEMIKLPATVRAYHSDGSVQYKEVAWDAVPTDATAQAGKVEVTGTVVGLNLRTKAHIRVSEQTVQNKNISKQWTGSELPAAFVSDTGGDDSASALNDTHISRNSGGAKNRWTNWRTGNEEDYAGILFGDAGDLTKRFVDNLKADFYTDGAIGLPEEYVIEYYVGKDLPELPKDVNHVRKEAQHPFNQASNWRQVTGLRAPQTLSANAENIFRFDKVETPAIRIRMKKKANTSGVGLTELTVMGNSVEEATSATAKLMVDGQPVPGFNSAIKEYEIVKKETGNQVTAEVSDNGLATVIPSASEKDPVRVLIKAENGQIVDEYRIRFVKESKQIGKPVAAETLSTVVNVGERLQFPTTVPVYYPSGTEWVKKDLAVTWNPVDESLLQTKGSFTLTGTIPGTDLQAQLKVRVSEQTGRNAALNQNHNDQDSLAFASTTNDTDQASQDRVHYVNDGLTNESNRWTNWSRQAPSKEVSVGVLFKKQGQIAAETVQQVGMQFFRDSGTDAPQSLVLEYYDGPDFTEPNPASRYAEQANHPFNDANNWKQLNYTADSEIVAGKMIHLNFEAVKTKAIRARMTRKDTTNGVALVEFTAVTPTEALQSTTVTNITVNGQALADFAADKTDYRLEYQGTRPRIEATATNNATVTVVQSDSDELPSLVRVVTEDGQTTKEYQIQLVKKAADATPPVHKTTPDEGVKNLVVEQPRLDIVTEALSFNTVERESAQLPKGTRKVVQEGKAGEKTTLVEVAIENGQETGRVTRDSFVSKDPVDQIVEVGKPVEQVTPDQGVQAPVVEQPRLDIVTEALPFNTVERETTQLPKGTRKVVQEGKAGEKTTLVEVTIENGQETGRVTRDSFVSKAPVDQIVEVGKPVEQVTPTEGVKNLVVEQPRLDVVTETLPFTTVERENVQLPTGARKVVQEGKDGEKTTLVEVTIENGQETGRVTRDSFVSKAPVDKIVEIGKPVEQVTPDEGVKAPTVEQPRLDIVTEALPFKTVERENAQLPKGARKVVQEGKAGEKTTLVEVTIENGQETGRVTRDSFVSKAPVDQIVEVGKPVEQVTPTEGVQNLVVEQPRLDVVTEPVPFRTVERESAQLPKGTRKVVQEGKAGEKTTLVEVTIENGQETVRTTRDSFVSKDPVDQIVEVGTKEEQPTQPSKPDAPVKPDTPAKPGKTEDDLRILTDEATKVQVIGKKSALEQVASLKVKKVTSQSLAGKVYAAYDITLEDKFGNPIQPSGKVLVSLPLAANKEVENVFYVTAANQLDALAFQQKGQIVEFMSDHFSVYAVVYKASQEHLAISQDDGSEKQKASESAVSTTSNGQRNMSGNKEGQLPNTGEESNQSAFLASLILALSSLFLLSVKDKKKY